MTTTTFSVTQAKKQAKLLSVPDGYKCPAETNTCFLGRVQVGHVIPRMTLDELDEDNIEDK